MRRLASVPIRIRLALGFALVMALVLAVTGFVLLERTRSDLDSRIEGRLAVDVTAAVAAIRDDGDDLGDPEHDPMQRLSPDGFVQVIGPGVEVLGATSATVATSVVIPRQRIVALSRAGGTVDLASLQGQQGGYRLAAARTQDDGVRYYVIAGIPLAEHQQALESLRRLLSIGGVAALLISSLLAYWLIGAALRPVEAMRGRATQITDSEPGRRLPVPAADDEIAELARTLNEMLGRLESAIEHERRFVADASHELRTPLSILKAEVELALRPGRDRDQQRAALVSIGEEVDRLSQLAEALLTIARAGEDGLPVRQRRFDGGELAAEVISRLPEASGRPAVLVEGKPEMFGDPQRLEQVLANLLDNAERYGGGADRVEVGSSDGYSELHVLDRGPGFAAGIARRAFDRFARADADRTSGGAGLGLAIVAAIAAAHEGEAGISPRQGGGADVWIRWPAAV